MTIIVKDDSDYIVGIIHDIDPDDIEQFKAELPLGWYVED